MTILIEDNIKDIYLDHAATTPLRQDVLDAMLPYFTEHFGNPSSAYRMGQESKAVLKEARDTIAKAINAEDWEIYFTSGGTESDTWALTGVSKSYRDKGNHIITSSIEHSAVLNTCKALEKEGFEITYLPVDSKGLIHVDDLKSAAKPSTILISIMFANNEIGTIQPIKEIGEFAKKNGIIFHTDAVQAFGQVNINVQEMNIDLLTLSGHKICGPKGIGALFIKKGIKIMPLIYGGSQERGRRGGTENVPGIVGLKKAVEMMMQDYEKNIEKLIEMREYLIHSIFNEIQGAVLNGHREKRLPSNVHLSFKGILNETLLIRLNAENIFVSAGSACTSGSTQNSHVLEAIGLDNDTAKSTIRVTLGCENTKEQMDVFVEKLVQTINELRRIRSSFGKE